MNNPKFTHKIKMIIIIVRFSLPIIMIINKKININNNNNNLKKIQKIIMIRKVKTKVKILLKFII